MPLLYFLLVAKSLFIVHLKEDPFLSKRREVTHRVVQEFRDSLFKVFQNEARQIEGFEVVKVFHVFPGAVISAEDSTVMRLSMLPIVERIVKDFKISLLDVSDEDDTVSLWHLDSIGLFPALSTGYSGEGVLIGFIDSGYDPTHPEIKDKAHPKYGFYDAVQYSGIPYDDVGHGTFVVSLAVGDSVGVARGASFSMARAFSGGEGYASDIHEAFEWFFSLFDSGAPPRIINGSFGLTGEPANTEFFDDILTLRSLGVIPIFAIGNEGPYGASTSPPGNYPIAIGVGAVDSALRVAYFSSRGPAPMSGVYCDTSYWPFPLWNYLKPDFVAPGVAVSGAWFGGYRSLSGTSASTPLVSGAIAILLEKNHSLTFEEIYTILAQSSKKPSHGDPYPNNAYGFGVINIDSALKLVAEDSLPHFYIERFSFDPPVIDSGYVELSIWTVNEGGPADSVIFYLTANKPYIHVQSDTILLPVEEGDTLVLPFVLYFDGATHYGESFTLTLHVKHSYEQRLPVHYHTGLTGENFLNIVGDSIAFTITSLGSIGFTSSSGCCGIGFHYPVGSPNVLYFGTFAVGNSPEYLVDHYYEANGLDEYDWCPVSTFTLRDDSSIHVIFDDSYHPSPKGLETELVLYSGEGSFSILEYRVRNTGLATLDSLYCALILDWDIGEAGTNRASVDKVRRAVFMWQDSLYYGSSLIEPAELLSNVSIIDNPSYVYPYSGFPDEIEFLFMKGGIRIVSGIDRRDYSTIVSAGPFTLIPGEEKKVVYAVGAGRGRYGIYDVFERAEEWYRDLKGEYPLLKPGKGYHIALQSPTVLSGEFSILFDYSYESAKPLRIALFNVTGRLVGERLLTLQGRGSFSVRFNKLLGSGIYFLRVGDRSTWKIVYLR